MIIDCKNENVRCSENTNFSKNKSKDSVKNSEQISYKKLRTRSKRSIDGVLILNVFLLLKLVFFNFMD